VQKRPDSLNPGSPLAQLGEVYLFEGRLAEARSTLEKSLTYLDGDDVIFIAMAKTDLAEVALAEGKFEQALKWLKEAHPYANQHVRRFIVFLCALAGYLVLSRNDKADLRTSAQLYGAIKKLSKQAGIGLNVFYQELNQTRMQRAQKKLSAAEWQKAYETGSGWKRGEAIQRVNELLNRME
jgi:tetratricopeptide (TPR) repeat protein